MAQATPSLGPVITLAKFYARKAVIADAQAAGRRWREMGYAELSRAACVYLDGHPELLAKATETLRQIDERDQQRREMRRSRRQLRFSNITSVAQRQSR